MTEFGDLMKRIVVFLTVWAMALAGVLASVVIPSSAASAAVPGAGALVARDTAGYLWLYPGDGAGAYQARRQIGSGWNIMTALVTPGDVTGDGNADVLGRDAKGLLWLYPGKSSGDLGARRQISSGWQTYTIVSAGNLNGAGAPDLLGRDSAGVLWLYPLSGNAVFGSRVRIGGGWAGLTLVGPGDMSGDSKADLLARNAAGALSLYRGTGTGGVQNGTLVGNGWKGMTALVGPGNWDGKVGNDLIARDASGRMLLYPGNNAGKLGAARQIGTGWNVMTYLGWSPASTSDVTAPGPVTSLTATAASTTSIALSWVNPTAADFTGVTIRRAPGAVAPTTVTAGTSVAVPASKTSTSFTDTGLAIGTQYSYAVFAHDGSGNDAVVAKVTATTTPVDVTAPGPVTGLTAAVVSNSITLTWTNPTDADFAGVTIRRALGATAPTLTTGVGVTDLAKTATSFTDGPLAGGQQYSYAVFAKDGVPNFAAAANASATTTNASRPTAVLTVNSSHGLTAKTTVGGYTASFDVTGSLAGTGSTLASAVLDYGDGSPTVSFTGDPATWTSLHDYLTVGVRTVTVVVTNSAGATATDSVAVTVYPSPTATIKMVDVHAALNQPVTFDLTSLTPAGTVFTDYDFCFDGTAGPVWVRQSGVPPTTTTHTFTAEGTYDAEFYVYNDADGWALASIVVRVDATAPGPVTALTATPRANSVALAWVNPTDADFTGVTIRRLAGATAPTLTTGTLVTDTAMAATSFTDTGLALGTLYTYAAFAHDGSGNSAAAVTVTGTTVGALPTAVLSFEGSTAATAKASVGGFTPFFDLTGSMAGTGTLVSASLDYGDGTTDQFTGDPATWSTSSHAFVTTGDMKVTAVVTNSAGDTATASILVTVYPMPVATITAPRVVQPNVPAILALNSSTPVGTVITDYAVSYDNGLTWDTPNGQPPTTLTHTFASEGTYPVLFYVYNDALGWALSSAQVRVDITPPGPVTNAQVSVVSVGDTFLSLSWDNPTGPSSSDFTGVVIRRQVGAIAPATVNDGVLVVDLTDLVPYVVDTGLTPGTQYSYTVFAQDGSGNYAAGVSMTGTTTGTPPHTVPPGLVTALTATVVSDTSIRLNWVNPGDLDFAGVTIRRAEGPIAPTSATTGDPVVVPASATATSFTDTGLTAGTQYSYAVFSYDTTLLHAAGVNVTKATTKNTTAGLVVDSRVTVGTEVFFDPASSYAATGATLAGTLDYGDGSLPDAFSGDPVSWAGFHTYATAGAQTVTLTVTDSVGKVVTKVITINVYDPPTASMPATAVATVGVPFTFPFTTSTPAGTAWQSWSLYGDVLEGGYGTAAPASTTTFVAAGTYTFTLTVTNDAGGVVESLPMVVTVQ
jgi:PKD domain/Fibronectin type III domain